MLKEEKDLYTIIKIYTCTCTVVDCSTTLYQNKNQNNNDIACTWYTKDCLYIVCFPVRATKVRQQLADLSLYIWMLTVGSAWYEIVTGI